MAEHNDIGKTGEALAALFLQRKGYNILHTNWRHGRNEVDIIAVWDKTLHFVEVKTKAGKGLGNPEQRVNPGKISRMKQVAEAYLEHNSCWTFIQFDILSITMRDGLPEEYLLIEDIF